MMRILRAMPEIKFIEWEICLSTINSLKQSELDLTKYNLVLLQPATLSAKLLDNGSVKQLTNILEPLMPKLLHGSFQVCTFDQGRKLVELPIDSLAIIHPHAALKTMEAKSAALQDWITYVSSNQRAVGVDIDFTQNKNTSLLIQELKNWRRVGIKFVTISPPWRISDSTHIEQVIQYRNCTKWFRKLYTSEDPNTLPQLRLGRHAVGAHCTPKLKLIKVDDTLSFMPCGNLGVSIPLNKVPLDN